MNADADAEDGDRSERLAWFEELYRSAGDDPDNVPWQNKGPHPALRTGQAPRRFMSAAPSTSAAVSARTPNSWRGSATT